MFVLYIGTLDYKSVCSGIQKKWRVKTLKKTVYDLHFYIENNKDCKVIFYMYIPKKGQ